MTNIQELIDQCGFVVSKWRDRQPCIEMLQDFAGVFGMELNLQLVPASDRDSPARIEPQPPMMRENPTAQASMFDETFANEFDLAPKRPPSMEDILRQNGF